MAKHDDIIDGRSACERCRRPTSVCWCEHLPTLPTSTRVLLLQHPRERRMAIGTARMAHLSLPGSQLRVGIGFDEDRVVNELLAAGDAYLLFPGDRAHPPETLPRDRPVTLVVVDGTWWQASKLVKENPRLAQLPRVALSPTRLSEYQIRRQPADFCVSTIEALAETLEVLEGRSFEALRVPFRAMVATQQRYVTDVGSSRHARSRRPRATRRDRLVAQLAELWPRIVLVQGDANGWSRSDARRQPSETIVWQALRPSTGERLDCVIAPRRPLAPSTSAHTGLTEAMMERGMTVAEWHARWAAFSRPDDEHVHWGRFYVDLAASEGLLLGTTLDLRPVLTELLRERVADVDVAATKLGVPVTSTFLGRAGQRLDALTAVVMSLRAQEHPAES
ncbi:MAG: tRNA-uridine aminocarboxypropyltransferase [Polyangia bacterium]